MPSFLTASLCDLGNSVYITEHNCHATKLNGEKKKKKRLPHLSRKLLPHLSRKSCSVNFFS